MKLAIEIGGTKLQLALGVGDGRLVGHWRGAIAPADGAAGIRRQIVAGYHQLNRNAGVPSKAIRACGVGFGGPVDDVRGRTVKSHQVDGWDDFPLAEWIQSELGMPAVIGNDADVAGLGEALFGAGRGTSPLFYVTIGSGIGGGLILNERIYRGAGRGAAEIGHLRIPSPAGSWTIVEKLASGWAIQDSVRRATGQTDVTTRDVAIAARQGDPASVQALATAREALAEALCHVVALVCPRRIVLGGGVSLIDDDLWLTPIRRLVAERVFAPFRDCFDIVPAALGEEVVLHGALGLGGE